MLAIASGRLEDLAGQISSHMDANHDDTGRDGLPCCDAMVHEVFDKSFSFTETESALMIVRVAVVGWFEQRPRVRFTETNFCSLNSIAVQSMCASETPSRDDLVSEIFS